MENIIKKFADMIRHNRIMILNHPDDKNYFIILRENTWYMHKIAETLQETYTDFDYEGFIKNCKSPLE